MAADQPSINLAQAVQIIAYELFVAGLAAREAGEGRGVPAA
jgi:tRNA C32,U32 (ribose-2'-O)-methylase TrmJ